MMWPRPASRRGRAAALPLLAAHAAALLRPLPEPKPSEIVAMAPRLSQAMDALSPMPSLMRVTYAGQDAVAEHQAGLGKGWSRFRELSGRAPEPSAAELLKLARRTLLETGAIGEMREVALSTASILGNMSSRGATLDSTLVGFKTPVAAWNNLFQNFSIPATKASFSLFANFVGPQANAVRLCIMESVAANNTTRYEVAGTNVWAGRAKWDEVPGWSFGTGSSRGWRWTLEAEPEVALYHSHVLDLDAKRVVLAAASREQFLIDEAVDLASVWMGHTWCGQDWEVVPLVLQDQPGSLGY